MADPWELQRLYDEVSPYIRMLLYRSPDMKRAKVGVERAKEIVESLGTDLYELHLRSVLESYIYAYENRQKKRLPLKDVLLENAYATKAVDILEKGVRAFLERREQMWDVAFERERAHLIETSARYTEFDEDIIDVIRDAWERLEKIYGEQAEIILDPTHKDKYMVMAGEGKVIFGYSKLPALYMLTERRLKPNWYAILLPLAEEYLHVVHFRRIRSLPPLFVNIFPHSEEIWVRLEAERVLESVSRTLPEEDRNLFDRERILKFGVAYDVYRKLLDMYLYEGRTEEAKELLALFEAHNPEREDWETYFRRRREILLALEEDPTENLKYSLRNALLLEEASPPPWWLERGKMSARALELSGLL